MNAESISSAAGWLLTYLLHSSVLLSATWLITYRWLSAPHFRDLLWKTALIGGFVTAFVSTWAGREPLTGYVALPAAVGRVTPNAGGTVSPAGREAWTGLLPRSDLAPSSSLPVRGRSPDVAATPSPAAPVAAGSVPAESRSLPGPGFLPTLLGFWAIGALLLAGRYLIQRARALRALGERIPATDGAMLTILDELVRQSGFRGLVRLTVSRGVSSPVALGGGEIVLPPGVFHELNRLQQRSLLAHELAHLARRDPQWLTFACLVERVFFLQPLNRLARIRQQEAAEYLCDDWAVHRTGSGDPLAACLLKVAEWIGPAPREVPLAGIAERPSQLVKRVHRLIEGNQMPTRTRTLLLAVAAVALIGATAVAAPRVAPAPAPAVGPGLTPNPAPTSPELAGAEPTGPAELVLQGVQDTGRSVQSAMARAQRELLAAQVHARVDARRVSAQARAELAAQMALVKPAITTTIPVAVHAELARARASLARLDGSLQRDTTSIAVPALIAALKDTDVDVRRAAAQSLANLEDVRAVPALIGATRDTDAEVRASAAMALGRLEDPRAQPALQALLKDGDKQVRYSALSALQMMPGDVPAEAILGAMSDTDSDIRQAALGLAVSQVGSLDESAKPDPRFAAAFSKLLADPSPDVRGQAAMGLGELRLTEAPPQLLAVTKDKSAEVRSMAAMALAHIGDPKAVPVLSGMVQDPDADVRAQAISALGEMRDRSATEALIAALKSTDPVVRRSAAQALGNRDEE